MFKFNHQNIKLLLNEKHLFYPALWGILTLSTLSSCRSEDNLNQQKQEKDMRFAVLFPNPKDC